MRERTAFPAALIARLARLRMIALTGSRSWTMDLAACTERRIVVCNTPASSPLRPQRNWRWAIACRRQAYPNGGCIDPQRRVSARRSDGQGAGWANASVIGLGKIRARMARYGQALGMQILAWSQNLTQDQKRRRRRPAVDKATLYPIGRCVLCTRALGTHALCLEFRFWLQARILHAERLASIARLILAPILPRRSRLAFGPSSTLPIGTPRWKPAAADRCIRRWDMPGGGKQ